MNSFLFGLALIGVIILLRWYILNDGDGQNDGFSGLLAMTSEKPKAPPPAPSSTKRLFRRKG
jgi:hypothetical protein